MARRRATACRTRSHAWSRSTDPRRTRLAHHPGRVRLPSYVEETIMAQANDSITTKDASGATATVATHLAAGKEHQVFMQANPDGHIMGSLPTYSAWSGVVAVAAANTVLWHLFNASGSG